MSFSKIDSVALAQCQRELGSRLPVFCVESTGSTNSDVAAMLASGKVQGDFALVANTQSAGRGRIPGRRWESLPGNIFLSCGFSPRGIPPARLANLTLWLGVSVATMLREKFAVPVLVKWPNDIWCNGRKMAGMLTEAHVGSGGVRGIIFGIGLNVNLDAEALPQTAELRATSLKAERGEVLDIHRVCAELLFAIENAYADFLAGTHAEKLYLIPGYFISLGLSFFVPRLYTAIAFDSGGVASGPLTSSFILPLAVGACVALQGIPAVMTHAFGIVAMVAMTPLITIQVMGFRAVLAGKVRDNIMMKQILGADDAQIIDFM